MSPQACSRLAAVASPLKRGPCFLLASAQFQLAGQVQSRQKNRLSGIPVTVQ